MELLWISNMLHKKHKREQAHHLWLVQMHQLTLIAISKGTLFFPIGYLSTLFILSNFFHMHVQYIYLDSAVVSDRCSVSHLQLETWSMLHATKLRRLCFLYFSFFRWLYVCQGQLIQFKVIAWLCSGLHLGWSNWVLLTGHLYSEWCVVVMCGTQNGYKNACVWRVCMTWLKFVDHFRFNNECDWRNSYNRLRRKRSFALVMNKMVMRV